MAGRKKSPPVPASDGAHAFVVVVEQLRGEFKVFGEALDGLRQRMNERFDAVDRRFERVEHELGEVKRDLGEVKQDLADVKVDLGLVKSAATTHTRELKEIRGALGNKVERGEVETIVEHVVARVAQR
jgi:archaellum component FlaC